MQKYTAKVIKDYSFSVQFVSTNMLTGSSVDEYAVKMDRKAGAVYGFKTLKSRNAWIEEANKEAGEIVAAIA